MLGSFSHDCHIGIIHAHKIRWPNWRGKLEGRSRGYYLPGVTYHGDGQCEAVALHSQTRGKYDIGCGITVLMICSRLRMDSSCTKWMACHLV